MKENSTPSSEAGGIQADERALDANDITTQIVDLNEFARKQAEREARAWRLSRGLPVLSDLSREYNSIRKSRGQYSVPLPEDLINGR
ncbi:MAG: hypothetical protein KZQ93_12730 [Candidatus Thiodiazotropha sp. (ex Monitilora ramsayi)]|nr:hypothetical protein [Candidatus Thiodiazotropha sp. (ex Monitilora ramsayi)]